MSSCSGSVAPDIFQEYSSSLLYCEYNECCLFQRTDFAQAEFRKFQCCDPFVVICLLCMTRPWMNLLPGFFTPLCDLEHCVCVFTAFGIDCVYFSLLKSAVYTTVLISTLVFSTTCLDLVCCVVCKCAVCAMCGFTARSWFHYLLQQNLQVNN